jgi:general stress protein 26
MERPEAVKKVAYLMTKSKLCMFATLSVGAIVSRPMATQSVEFDGDLWFFAYEDSDKVAEIAINPACNVSFESGSSWVSLSGNAVLVHDNAKAKELWNPSLKAWFPDELDEPGLALIKVNASSGEYWDSSNNTLVSLFGTAKAAITGERAEGGENETVRL